MSAPRRDASFTPRQVRAMYCGHQLARAESAQPCGPVEQPRRLHDQVGAPETGVLKPRRDHGAASVQPGRTPRLGEADQGGQAQDFRLTRHKFNQQSREPQHLFGERRAIACQGGVLVGHGVGDLERGQHRIQPLVPGLADRNFKRDASVSDLALGPGDPLRHGRFGDQKGLRQLLDRQAADHLQRQGRTRLRPDGRVTADEDQP